MSELQRLILAASLSPEQLERARGAFDAAWTEIAENYKGVDATKLGRTRLATMVLGVMSDDCGDVTKIKDAALALMRREEAPVPLERSVREK